MAADPRGDASTRVAEDMAAAHAVLARRWLERLSELLQVGTSEIFPSANLLDHIPELISEVASYLGDPANREIAANTAVMAKAAELALLRYQQRASLHQLLREYEILSDVLDAFIEDEIRAHRIDDGVEAVRIQRRVSHAVQSLQRHTVDTFVTRYVESLEARNQQARGFNRLISHELRQPIGVLHLLARVIPASGAAQGLDPLIQMLDRNVRRLADVVAKLEHLARIDAGEDSPVEQEADLGDLARDVAEQLREMAEARGVRIQIADGLPRASIEPARMGLVLVNLLANAIKYSDPAKADRYVAVREAVASGSLAIEVVDNGIGIPASRLGHVFNAFARAHAERDAELGVHGLGLGLNIVRECMEAMHGTVEVRSVENQGTTFVLSWPRPSAFSSPAGEGTAAGETGMD
jgi:signal transduction histidine kinase